MDDSTVPIGTTIQFYDPIINAWTSTWTSPTQSLVQWFITRLVEELIVPEYIEADWAPLRWTFSDIAPDSFRWRSETLGDDST
jgi:hypothetical protein